MFRNRIFISELCFWHGKQLPTLSWEGSTDFQNCIEGVSHQEMTNAIAKGKANHEEVLDAGQKAAKDVQVRNYTNQRTKC